MQAEREKAPQLSPEQSCPFLGMKNDPATFLAYPSKWNTCYRVEPVSTPVFSHQRDFCLQASHHDCPVFKAELGERMPEALVLPVSGMAKRKKRIIAVIVGGVLILLLVIAIILNDRLFTGTANLVETPLSEELTQSIAMANQATSTPAQSFSPTLNVTDGLISQTATLTAPSETALPTASPTSVPLALETPIGGEIQFIIHRVVEGESLVLYANWFETSMDAITAVNYNLSIPLWAGTLIVIPIDQTDATGLPAFEVYEVLGGDIVPRDLAEQLSMDLEAFCRYNNIEPDHALHDGEWVLIPRERIEP
jgi:hypothetical protein